MAGVPICSKILCKDPIRIRQYDPHVTIACNRKSVPFLYCKKFVNPHKFYCVNTHENGDSSSEVQTNVRQLKPLDAYLSKIDNRVGDQENSSTSMNAHGNSRKTEELHMEFSPSNSPKKSEDIVDSNEPLKARSGLGSLVSYFGKLKSGVSSPKNETLSSNGETFLPNQITESYAAGDECDDKKEDSDLNGRNVFGIEKYLEFQQNDEGKNLALINFLISINIGVSIFEIASPIKNPDVEHLSLPLAYGAKINHLILDGEWWRLVTPMFLHSGFLHVCLGCWVLLTFGPQVCRGYGSFTFFLIFILGGISGNLSSFLHTPELTVGGTGPVFATLGAWFIYQIQNKESVSERMFQKAVMATLLSFLSSNLELVDDWTHVGAVLAGVIYGFLTCPTMEMGNASPRNGQDEGVAIIRRQAGPCRSFIIFTIFIVILSALLLFLEPQFGFLELGGFQL